MRYRDVNVELKVISQPQRDCSLHPVTLTDETIEYRFKKVISKMEENNFDALFIYADMEHGSNFEYLIGFLPRFEEAVLVLKKNKEAYLFLGNENLNKASKARIEVKPIHYPKFSLPNQPCKDSVDMKKVLEDIGLKDKKIGVVGWKNYAQQKDNHEFEIPSYLMEVIKNLTTQEKIVNATFIFIGDNGVRTTNNANEIAHYEFGASLASDSLIDAMNALKVGVTEMSVADKLSRYGQRNSVTTIVAFGERFVKANMYPTDKKLSEGDTVSITIGQRGGLSSRIGYAIEEITEKEEDYFEKIVVPYFYTIVHWLKYVKPGKKGKEVYDYIESIFPKDKYGWYLCPGHLTAEEEWVSSPIYEGSEDIIKSGMIFQTDIIPSVKRYLGTCMESTVLIADERLQEDIMKQYPEMWRRFLKRKDYIKENIGVNLPCEILPMTSTLCYLKPFLLTNEAVVIEENE